MIKQRIILRADGNSKIGLGHISRCLALAEILSKKFRLSFALQDPDEKLLETIKRVTGEVLSLKGMDATDPDFIHELEPYLTGEEIVVLDGYHFNLSYEQQVKKNAKAVVFIDDIPNRHFVSDAIFNFCGSLSVEDYSKEFYTQIFSGLKYVFLRSPFLSSPPERKKYNDRLFLNMGGSDPNNDTLKILEELVSKNYSGEIEVVVGNSYTHLNSLEAIRKNSASIMIHRGLDANEMHQCMGRCSIAIVPPSTVALEFLSTGGLAFLHQTADNQALQRKYLIQSALALEYSDFESMRSENVESFFQSAIMLQGNYFDGSSIERVQKIFDDLTLSLKLVFRTATLEDSRLCFDWANDHEARKYSYSTSLIPWPQHELWFNKKLTDKNCYYFIAEIGNEAIGQIRFDFQENEEAFQISYTLDPRWRGKGLGYYILVSGMQKLISVTPVKKIVGYVQEINLASVKAFQKAGFKGSVSEKHPDSLKFELSFTL